MAAFSITSACKINPTPVWNAVFGPDGALTTSDVPRSPITIANGIAYVVGFSDNTVHAFDASGGTQLWSGALNSLGVSGPVVINGRLYVAAYGGSVYAWYTGILPSPHR
jgi:outer membrane protein assembly factor BamB